MFPKFGIEPDFAAGADPFWNGVRESDQSVKDRAREVVERIFKSERKEETCKYQFLTPKMERN